MTIKVGEETYYSEEYVKKLEERISKAIEYINKNYDTDIEDVFELLEILKGE